MKPDKAKDAEHYYSADRQDLGLPRAASSRGAVDLLYLQAAILSELKEIRKLLKRKRTDAQSRDDEQR